MALEDWRGSWRGPDGAFLCCHPDGCSEPVVLQVAIPLVGGAPGETRPVMTCEMHQAVFEQLLVATG
ncbi:MAG: hypothetical protein JWP11_1333 [Frankiales bacterium]|nr:hypothetical protein [Frankiales bacterium]